MGVEYNLLGLPRIGAHEQHAAVAQPDMLDLDGDRYSLMSTTSCNQSNW
jgi:hypothetical protein